MTVGCFSRMSKCVYMPWLESHLLCSRPPRVKTGRDGRGFTIAEPPSEVYAGHRDMAHEFMLKRQDKNSRVDTGKLCNESCAWHADEIKPE